MTDRNFITGIGGVFFKCADKNSLMEWYRDTLGIGQTEWGHDFEWRDKDDPAKAGRTVWGVFDTDTEYFAPSDKPYMINYRVRNLDALLEHLKSKGVEQIGKIEAYDYGRFAWIIDPEGTKIELWEPLGA